MTQTLSRQVRAWHAWTLPVLIVGICQACAPARVRPDARLDLSPPQREILLWNGSAPGALADSAEDRPSITAYLPPGNIRTGAAALIFGGGAYRRIAFEKESIPAARWLNSIGVTAFVVRYRLGPRYHHPIMLEDAERAVRTVRARAAEWGVDTQRIGVIGFSAGGHLASTVATHFHAGDPLSSDVIDRASSRPDFAVLVYPVITMDGPSAHSGSRAHLLADTAVRQSRELLSNEKHVTREMAPTFIVGTTNDAGVSIENSLLFYNAARSAGVPVEMHLFESGTHGFGLATGDPVLSQWPELCAAWMRAHGWLSRG